MKKTFFLIFVLLISSVAWAIVCEPPLECDTMASEVCTKQKLKLFGTDECVSCSCPDGTVKITDGTCCPTEKVVNVLTENLFFKEEPSDESGYLRECCTDLGKEAVTPALRGFSYGKVCCSSERTFTKYDRKVCCMDDLVNGECKCEAKDKNGVCCMSENFNSADGICCTDEKVYASQRDVVADRHYKICCPKTNVYEASSNSGTVVWKGCCHEEVENGECKCEVKDKNGKCCKDESLNNKTKECCPNNEKVLNGECCSNVQTYKDSNGNDVKKCCQPGELINDLGECCSAQTYKDSNGKEVQKCCSSGEIALNGSGECCTEDKKYLGTEYGNVRHEREWLSGIYLKPKKDYYLCCKGDLYDYETYVAGEGDKKIKQCCNNGYVSCPSGERGTTISVDGYCSCGCHNNSDCNKHWKEGDDIYYCQTDHTCKKAEDVDISGIRGEIRDFAGGQLTQEKVEALISGVRERLVASTGEEGDKNLMITFSAELSDPLTEGNNGYSIWGNKTAIVINSGTCTKGAGYFNCKATIVHENVHRMDNVNQPIWNRARKDVTTLYQFCLTEIHAQAGGALTKVRDGFESCYRYRDGQIYSTCAPLVDFDPAVCKKCSDVYKSFQIGEPYAEKYMNYQDAKKYYTDWTWAQENNCNGLQAQLEEDFANSSYAEITCWSKRRAEAKKILDTVNSTVLDAVQGFKQASSKDQGLLELFGLISRTGFLWKGLENQSPDLVSDIAALYAQNATLCMSPSRFANHPAIRLGFEGKSIIEFEEAYDFIKANPDCGPAPVALPGSSYVLPSCQEKLDCLTEQWRTECWPVAEWASHVGEIETYTFN